MAIEDLADPLFAAVKSHVAANWTLSAVAWPNEPFDRQEAGWLSVEIAGTVYGQASIGAETQADNRFDEDGTLWGHVFVKTGSGMSACRAAAKAFADLFRGQRLLADSVEFLDAEIGMGEPGDDNGNWFRISVAVGWRQIDA